MAKQIGALWVNEYKKNGEAKKMLSGRLDLGPMGDIDIAVFPNDRKEKPSQPDYRIVLSERSNGKGTDTGESKDDGPEPF
jgi:uncharacterized protein (DUF736 family)